MRKKTARPNCAKLFRASAIQIVRPLESIAETQPKLQPALLRLSAMTFQYTMRTMLVIVRNRLRCGLAQFKLRTHFLQAWLYHAEKRATTERVTNRFHVPSE